MEQGIPASYEALNTAVATTVMNTHPVGSLAWNYESGLILCALWELAKVSKEQSFLDHEKIIHYVKDQVDTLILDDGSIKGYKKDEFNLDQINSGKIVLELYEIYKDEKYLKACQILRDQLRAHPRTELGGYWHKKIYPHQIWLDGLYMYGPFAVRWGQLQGEEELLREVAKNLQDIREKTLDPETGLLRHAWDERALQLWADPRTGRSPHAWGRAMGWYCMALVDVLGFLSEEQAEYQRLRSILQDCLSIILKYRDPQEKMWYQILDQRGRTGNYLETSCSSMFCYTMAKAWNRNILTDETLIQSARESYTAIVKRYLRTDTEGKTHLGGICKVAGLGGNPYRDGSFAYYMSEPVVEDDFKGLGPFILAGAELIRAQRKR
ncbi:MAG: glycoside hydrolase family 88 protein [Breznakiellaceae bacterium]